MLKNSLRLCCAMLLTVMLTACIGESNSKIAVVDLAEVQNSSILVAEVAGYLEGLRGELMADALEAEKAFQENETDESRQLYMDAVDRFESAVSAEEQRIFSTLSDSIDKILNDYRAANNVQAILLKETVLSYDVEMDITKAITAELDKVKIDLGPPAAEPTPTETTTEAEPSPEAQPATE